MVVKTVKKILVTGAYGFIGSNLCVRLSENDDTEVIRFGRNNSIEDLTSVVSGADWIVHLAGENRPKETESFNLGNVELTSKLCVAIQHTGRNIPLVLASSVQAENDSLYGKSKLAAEQVVQDYAAKTNNSVCIYRLPGVFGKWCKANYNSVVATFCHNISRGLPIQINNPKFNLNLVYIDHLVDDFLSTIQNVSPGVSEGKIRKTFDITLGELANQIKSFKNCRENLIIERVGLGLVRALYSTYLSYLPKEKFTYDVPKYEDIRGSFVEVLKTPDAGQFSVFTIKPGFTRGSHYHHSKTEKFLILKGLTRLRFRHLITDEKYEVTLSGEQATIIDTIPGWVHDITNIGDSEAYVMLWANEIFDRNQPDTVAEDV